jgi:hypothetical protein
VSHVHWVGGEKGGVGKSVVARLLAQWFIDRSRPFAAIDADHSHGALLRFYADYTQAGDLTRPDSADQIMDRALGAERAVLVDLPGQSLVNLQRWLEEADVLRFSREMGVGFTFWHVSDGSYASVTEIGDTLELLGDQARHILVKNRGRGPDFSQFDESTAARLLGELGGRILELPALDATTMYRIDALGSSFWAAAHSTSGPFALGPMDRQRTKLWLQRAFASLDELADEL